MSYERMKQAEVELKAQIDALLARAKAADEAEVNDCRAAQRMDQERAGVPAVQPARAAPGASRVEARVHGAEPAAHGGVERKLTRGGAVVRLTGACLAEGGWRVRSNKLELPHGGGSGEPCVKPQARRLGGFCRAAS
jgi:hypothetical protein